MIWPVAESDGRIVVSPPVVARFRGQPLDNLVAWMRRQNGLRLQQLGS